MMIQKKGLSNESDNDSNDETEFDHDEFNNLLKTKKYFNNNRNLIVCINHALLGFYLRQYV